MLNIMTKLPLKIIAFFDVIVDVCYVGDRRIRAKLNFQGWVCI